VRNPAVLALNGVVAIITAATASERNQCDKREANSDGFHITAAAARTCRFVVELYYLLIIGKLSNCHDDMVEVSQFIGCKALIQLRNITFVSDFVFKSAPEDVEHVKTLFLEFIFQYDK
jgi:hypothetical protein